ncbi:MAG: hypothetical protein RIT04_263 [Candidatus Parcubacteria bacterium]|jgi:hypothetical protein
MNTVTLFPIRGGSLAQVIEGHPDGTLLVLHGSDHWTDLVPHDEGVLLKKPGCDAWFVNGYDTVEQFNAFREEMSAGQIKPITAPTIWPDPAFKKPGAWIDAKGYLNGEIPVRFPWKQFWGHKFGAVFELSASEVVLLLHRPVAAKKSG